MESPTSGGDQAEFQPVLSTHQGVDIAVIKSLLDAEAIPYFFQGEAFHQVYPGAQPVRLMVRADQVERAKAILNEVIPPTA